MQFESIPFTRELLTILKGIPKEQWDLLSIPELVKRTITNLQRPSEVLEAVPTSDPNILEVKVGDVQSTHEHIS